MSNQPRFGRGSSALRRPLAGRVVIVTRPRRQSAELCQRLESYGAEAVAMPTIAIAPAPDPEQVRRAMLQLSTYDRVILTSANPVRALKEALERAHVPMSALGGLKVCSIGPGTSRALSEIGIEPDLSASEYRAEGLLAQLPGEAVTGERVLLFRAQQAREVLPETLRQRGAIVDVVAAYVTTLPAAHEWIEGLQALRAGRVDAITLTSASTGRHLLRILGDDAIELLDPIVVAAIGPVTADACAEEGLKVDVVSPEHTVAALVEALVVYFGRRERG